MSTAEPEMDHLQHGIEQTRADMSETLGALEARLKPAVLREQVGAELQHVEDRVRVVLRETLNETKAIVHTELLEARNLLQAEVVQAEQRVKRGLGEAKETVKKDLQDAFMGAKQSVRAATLGRVEDLATELGDKMNDTRDTLVDTIRNNPVPAALVGFGFVWLLMNRSTSASRRGRGSQWHRTEAPDPQGNGQVVEQLGSAIGQAGAAVGKVAHQATDAVGQGLHQASDAAGRAIHSASDTALALAHTASDTASHLAHQAGEAATFVAGRAGTDARRVEQGLQNALRQNPLALGAAALATGAVVGYSLPRTHGEDAFMGATRDNLLHQAGGAVHDAAVSAVAHLAEEKLEGAKAATNARGADTAK